MIKPKEYEEFKETIEFMDKESLMQGCYQVVLENIAKDNKIEELNKRLKCAREYVITHSNNGIMEARDSRYILTILGEYGMEQR